MLANVSISEPVQKTMTERSRRTGITADRVLNELNKIGFSNAADADIINFESAEVNPSAGDEDPA